MQKKAQGKHLHFFLQQKRFLLMRWREWESSQSPALWLCRTIVRRDVGTSEERPHKWTRAHTQEAVSLTYTSGKNPGSFHLSGSFSGDPASSNLMFWLTQLGPLQDSKLFVNETNKLKFIRLIGNICKWINTNPAFYPYLFFSMNLFYNQWILETLAQDLIWSPSGHTC